MKSKRRDVKIKFNRATFEALVMAVLELSGRLARLEHSARLKMGPPGPTGPTGPMGPMGPMGPSAPPCQHMSRKRRK